MVKPCRIQNLDNMLPLSGAVRGSLLCRAWKFPAATENVPLLRCASGSLVRTEYVSGREVIGTATCQEPERCRHERLKTEERSCRTCLTANVKHHDISTGFMFRGLARMTEKDRREYRKV